MKPGPVADVISGLVQLTGGLFICGKTCENRHLSCLVLTAACRREERQKSTGGAADGKSIRYLLI